MKKLIMILILASTMVGCSHAQMKAFADGFNNNSQSANTEMQQITIVDQNNVTHYCTQYNGTISNCH